MASKNMPQLDFGEEEKKQLSNGQMAIILGLMLIATAIPIGFAITGDTDAFAIIIAIYIFGAVFVGIIQEWIWPPYKKHVRKHVRRILWRIFDWLAERFKN